MVNEYVDNFFESLYKHELDQKHRLESSDSLIIGVLGALTGVAAYYINLLASLQDSAWCILLYLLVLIFMIYLAGGICHATMSIWPKERAFIASASEWSTYVDGVEGYHRYYHRSEDAIIGKVALDLALARRTQYVKAGEVNRKVILKKAAYQTEAKKCIAIAVVIMLITVLPLYFILCDEADSKKANKVRATSIPSSTSLTLK